MIYKTSDLILGALGISLISNAVLSSKLKKAERKIEVRDNCIEMMNRTTRYLMDDNDKLRAEVKAVKKK